ncbi:hypothetical protein [Pyrobaculum neutrophilum]|uniref:Uncharacterized protein n=1 Tax=Pyrobaculum neutrophilum (strain DSM 2338 / JCM 9278 / NBRC 100436 / V24Sta) TaxID=444157 RepID=B1YDL4_PYRNV|nr:hypothetical protein [Pyrobaculum neutrophilum]ACB39877.1 hypothetical protein Tneu_0940 [Pyrobaculum neutrophilum V24Sta]
MILVKTATYVFAALVALFKNESGSHYLVFIDPEGLDIHFSTIQTIVEATGGQCDLLILFNTSSINRTIGGEREDSLTKFFGGEEWRGRNAEELLDLYKEKLKRLYSDIRDAKPYVESIEIDDPDIGWRYDMILLTREGDYTDVWKDLKDRIEKHRPQDVEIAKKTLDGLQTRLDNWAGPLLHYLDTT